MKKFLFAVCIALFATLGQARDLKPYDGAPLPDFTLPDMGGKQHTLSSYRGKVVMVNFWATYCGPCIKEIPSMARLRQKLGDKPFEILAIDMAEEKSDVEAFMQRHNIKVNFPILLDIEGNVIEQWMVSAVPSTFIVDTKGDIRYTFYGGLEWDSEEVIADITGLME